MFEVDLGSLLDEVEAAGDLKGEEWLDGQYKFEIIRTNTGRTKDGKSPKMGLLWKAVDGPYAGQSQWENLTIQDNPTSKAIFMNKLVDLGLSKDTIRSAVNLEQIASMLEGTKALVDFQMKPWSKNPDKKSPVFRVVRLIDDSAPESVEDEGLFS